MDIFFSYFMDCCVIPPVQSSLWILYTRSSLFALFSCLFIKLPIRGWSFVQSFYSCAFALTTLKPHLGA